MNFRFWAARCGLMACLVLFTASSGAATRTQHAKPSPDSDLRAVETVLDTPEDKIDLARAMLTIDRLIDPSVNAEATLKTLDLLTEAVLARVPVGAPARDVEEA